MKTSRPIPCALLVVLAAAACGDDVTGGSRPDPASLTADTSAPAAALVGSDVDLGVRVTDARGGPVGGVRVQWRVVDGEGTIVAASTSGSDGYARTVWTLGQKAETQRASAAVVGLEPVVFEVQGTVPVTLVSIEPAVLEPGVTATLSGSNFGATAGENVVRIGGAAATITGATPTRLTILVPERAALPCVATGALVDVSVEVSGAIAKRGHPLSVAERRDVAVGQAIVGQAAELGCMELSKGGYVISVFNAGPSARSIAGFRASFANAGTAPSVPATAIRPTLAPPEAGRILDLARERARLHREALARSHDLQERLWPQRTRPDAALRPGAALEVRPPQLGDTVSIRIPNLLGNLCEARTVVAGRVVYSGTKAVILEDAAAPLAGQMDALYGEVGAEFDTVVYPLLVANFGDPLAFDASTDGNGRVYILYSKVINDFGGGLLGFVSSGDFFSRTVCPASNQAEIFYTIVPTSAADGFSVGTRDYWRKLARGIMVHELKHVASFAERLARDAAGPEAMWLEEATAQIALEMWARTVYGYGAGDNVDYRSSLYCEYRTFGECEGLPWAVGLGFEWLTDFYMAPEIHGPVMERDMGGFSQVYGSGWSFIRWVVDTHAGTEADLLRSLVQERSLAGVDNLVAKTGRQFGDMVGEWLLATAVDDRPGFTPANPRYTLPSWNTRSIYEGLYADFNAQYGWPPKPFPLAVRTVAPGASTFSVGGVIGGGSAFFEVGGTDQGGPIFGVGGAISGAADPRLRVSVIRVQ